MKVRRKRLIKASNGEIGKGGRSISSNYTLSSYLLERAVCIVENLLQY